MSNAVATPAGTGSTQLTAAATLSGVTIRETAGAAASLVLRNGTTTADPIVFLAKMAANGMVSTLLPNVACPDGIFLHRESGTTEVVIHAAPMHFEWRNALLPRRRH